MIFTRCIDILGVRVDDVTNDEALICCDALLRDGGQHQITTPNAEFVALAWRDEEFRKIINRSALSIPDGHSLLWASRLFGCALREQVTGTDLADALAGLAARDGRQVFLLGAADGVARAAGRRLEAKHAGLNIAGCYAGSPRMSYDAEVRREVAKAGPIDILLVAYGAPNQEQWIARNLPHLDVRLAMGVGGVFDFLSGRLPRAPGWVRNAGLDWLYRLAHEPRRLRRQLTIPQFLALTLAKRLSGYRGSFRTRNLSGNCVDWGE